MFGAGSESSKTKVGSSRPQFQKSHGQDWYWDWNLKSLNDKIVTKTQNGGHFFNIETKTRIILYTNIHSLFLENHKINNSAYIFHMRFKSVLFFTILSSFQSV